MTDGTTLFRFSIREEDAEERLDVFLADQEEPPLSRSQVRKYLDRGEITVNKQQVKAGYKLRPGDDVLWVHQPAPSPSTAPEPIELNLLFEDEDLAIIDKPAGLVVHPAPGHPRGTLVNALTYHFDRLSDLSGELRPGIVHRLDKDTSGALAVTFTDRAHRHLAAQFRDHRIERVYHGIVFEAGLSDSGTFETGHGRHPTQRMRFTGNVDGKRRAITHYKVLERFDSGACLVECRLETGRTHQIRMHLSEAGSPILGDHLYGGKATAQVGIINRQALHALFLGLEHPNGDWIERSSPYPQDFQAALDTLRAGRDWR